MRNKMGFTITERITKDIEHAESVNNAEQKRLLAHMAIAAAELAIDFGLITYAEWSDLTSRAFSII
jgi:hypothetical protein